MEVHDLPKRALRVGPVPERVEALLEGYCRTRPPFNSLPHDPIGALAQPLADLEALAHVALDVVVCRLGGHGSVTAASPRGSVSLGGVACEARFDGFLAPEAARCAPRVSFRRAGCAVCPKTGLPEGTRDVSPAAVGAVGRASGDVFFRKFFFRRVCALGDQWG